MYAIYVDGKFETSVYKNALEYVVGLLRTMIDVESEFQTSEAVYLYTNPPALEEII